MRASRLSVWFAALVLLGVACATTDPLSPEVTEDDIGANPEVVEGETPGIDVAPLTATRGTQRLTVDSLEASIPAVAGDHITGYPITWKAGNDEALSDDVYGRVLGLYGPAHPLPPPPPPRVPAGGAAVGGARRPSADDGIGWGPPSLALT